MVRAIAAPRLLVTICSMWWWVWGVAAVLLLIAYVSWLTARVNRLHRRVETATAALDAALVRRAAAAAVLADELAARQPQLAADLYAAARAALDPAPSGGSGWTRLAPDREGAENDLTLALHRLPESPPDQPPAWPNVVTASRRAALARQVHTDVVRDALVVRRRVPVRVLGLARRHDEPAYFDIGDPALEVTETQPTAPA